jgi:hypothetical protein
MEFIPLVQMAVLVFAIINFLKAVKAKDGNAAFTQVVVWVAGVLVVLLAAQTDFASGINIGDEVLTDLNFWSLLFIGLTISSLASFGVEIKKALDNTDSSKSPPLLK